MRRGRFRAALVALALAAGAAIVIAVALGARSPLRANGVHAAAPSARAAHRGPRPAATGEGDGDVGRSADEAVIVSGVVRDDAGRPVASAAVYARAVSTRDTPETRIDADASGRFAGRLPRGQYVLRATAAGYAPDEAWIIATRDTDIDFKLAGAAVLRGSVVAHDGSAVPGATVVVERRPAGTPGGAATATTDASGAFELRELSAGDYDVAAAEGPRFGRAPRPVTLAAGAVGTVTVEVSRAQSVSGHVRLRGGAPVAGARVVARGPSGEPLGAGVVSGPDGAYRLDGVPAGNVVVRADAAGHDGAEARTAVDDGHDAHGVDVVLLDEKDEVTLEGIVVYDDGTPADGALVSADERSIAVGEDGAFLLARVRAGDVVLRATLDRSPDAEPLVAVVRRHAEPGEHVTGLRVVLPRGMAHIKGIVVDARGQPLAGALVGAVNEEDVADDRELGAAIADDVARGRGVARSGADGSFAVTGIEEGTFVVWATYEGLARVVVADVAAGAEDVRIQFAAPTRLAGVVVAADGTPARAYRLLVRGEDESGRPAAPEAHTVRDDFGAFDVRGLRAGTYSLLAQTEGGLAAKLDGVVVGDGEEKTGLRLVTTAGITLEGRIIDADTRRPIAGAHVVLVGQIGSADTDESGVYRIPGLAADGGVRLYTEVDGDDYVYDARSVDLSLRQGRVALADAWMMRAPRVEADGETGLVCENWDGRVMVEEVSPGSPAQAAGMRAGDRVLVIETTPASPFGDAAIDLMLRGSPGTSVTLTVARLSGAVRRVSIIRATH